MNLLKKPCCGVASVSSDLTDASSASSYPTSTDLNNAANGGANTPSLEELLRAGSSMVRDRVPPAPHSSASLTHRAVGVALLSRLVLSRAPHETTF